jgi:glycosyltransferase involved in cell wall biosynthesis
VHNQRDALICYTDIMPGIWKEFPDAELWLVGSNPPASLQALSSDPRVKVTGFVEDVQSLLSTMSAVVCPWTGTYGFRSRLIEVMALGIPLVASPDAVYGMELENGKGLLLGEDNEGLLKGVMRLLKDDPFAKEQSKLAREQVTRLYSLETTYDRLTSELHDWLKERKRGKG